MNTTALEMYQIDDTQKLPDIADLSSTTHGYTHDLALHHVHTAARTGFNQFEWLAQRLDGSTFWTEISLKSAVIGGEAKILGGARDITQRKQAEHHLQQSLQDKEILLKELYHRTKNNMQIISGLLNLQSNDFSDPRLIQAFIEAENRIHAMSLVHEKLYASQNLASITADDYLEDLVNQIVQSYASMAAGISIQVEAQAVSLTVECAVPLGLAINELISNSIKYAFPITREDAKITLLLTQLNEPAAMVELVYCDNGIGVSDVGAMENSSSLGIHLIKSIFREQLGGTARFSNRGELCCTARFSLTHQ